MKIKTTSELIKELVQQISLKEISTKDFVAEMTEMYQKIEGLESNYKNLTEENELNLEGKIEKEKELEEYKKEYVIPAKKYSEREKGLVEAHQDWNLERKYIARENEILREVLGNITAIRNVNAYNNGNSYNENPMKPNLPKLEEKKETN